MIGMVIIAHGSLGEALIRCASHVLGRAPLHLLALEVTVRDDPDRVHARALELVRQVNQGVGVLVLTDILGATPANIATRLVRPGEVEAVAGVNLPMLVRALTYRGEPLATVLEKAVSGGHQGVAHIVPEAGGAARRS
jgi:PTS system ascorbate-specific IIA component